MTRLQKLQAKRSKLVIGLISGTSADGVDAALVRIRGTRESTRVKLIAFKTYAYPPTFRETLLQNSLPGQGTVGDICDLNFAVAYSFADAVRKIVREGRVALSNVDLIGSHGQTIHHLPDLRSRFGKKIRSTLQIGDPSLIAKLTGIPTVGDFRTADMAVGGQGAPLVPYLDYILFRSKNRNRVLLNLGGIANITVLPRNCSVEQVSAFDTGPANMVIDALMEKLFHKPFDREGRVAKSGRIMSYALDWMLSNPYFGRKPPKSTGREMFGEYFVDELLRRAKGWSHQDIVATATEFTAVSVFQQYRKFVHIHTAADELVVSGGGVHNPTLMQQIRNYFAPIPVVNVKKYSLSPDAKEAVLFAVLASETIAEHPSNIPRATGAKRPVILGKICL